MRIDIHVDMYIADVCIDMRLTRLSMHVDMCVDKRIGAASVPSTA